MEYMKGWIQEGTHKKDPLRRRWKLVVKIGKKTFGDRTPLAELSWATMFLTLKGKEEYP